MDRICYIVGAGDNGDTVFRPQKGDLVIAADGGFAFLEKNHIEADLVVGDFDSLGRVPEHPHVIKSPAEKDETDIILAAGEGLRLGYRTFALFGCQGGRFDHTFACIQTLAYLAERGAVGYMLGGGIAITAVKNGELRLDKDKKGIISVFCIGKTAKGVNLTGLKYRLSDADVSSFIPIGVSNEFTGAESVVSVSDGTLIVMWYQNASGILEDIREGRIKNILTNPSA
jgi:thiamine pyrophosphokinase